MSEQLHKRFTTEQVKTILEKYLAKEIKAKEACAYLEIGRTRLYQLAKQLSVRPGKFDIGYQRKKKTTPFS